MKPTTMLGRGDFPPDRHPVTIYLARLAQSSRRTMKQALDSVAAHLTHGKCDARTLDWGKVRHQHTHAVHAILMKKHAPSTVNKKMSAVRSVLKIAWRLGYIGADDHRLATNLPYLPVPISTTARAVTAGELRALFCSCALDRTPKGRATWPS